MCALLQDCQPLVLRHPASGDEFSFAGVREVVGAAVEASDVLSPLTAIGTGPAHPCLSLPWRDATTSAETVTSNVTRYSSTINGMAHFLS